MIAYAGQGRPRTKVRAGSHARVEQARQALVNAEEAYLIACQWIRVQANGDWLWALDTPAMRIAMYREGAVKFQRSLEVKS